MIEILASEIQQGDRLYADAAYGVVGVRPVGDGRLHVATVRKFFYFAPGDVVTVTRKDV